MRALIVGLISGFVALVGFSSLASASATIDLIWANSGNDTSSGFATSSNITLNVILTAGANGSVGGGVSVDYSDLVGDFTIVSFQDFHGGPLPINVGNPSNSGTQINNLNSTTLSAPPAGLAAGQSYLLGTITFHSLTGNPGTYQIDSVIAGTDGLADGFYNDITGTSTYNSAFAIVPEPGTLALLGMGMGGLYGVGRRSRPKRA